MPKLKNRKARNKLFTPAKKSRGKTKKPVQVLEQVETNDAGSKNDGRPLQERPLKKSVAVHHRLFDPFKEAFEIQLGNGQVKRYKQATRKEVLSAIRDEKPAEETSPEDEFPATSVSGLAATDGAKMAKLHKLLMEIQKKQSSYQGLMSRRVNDAKIMQAKIHELEAEKAACWGTRQFTKAAEDTSPLHLTKHQIVFGAAQILAEPALSFVSHQIMQEELPTNTLEWKEEMRKFSLELYRRSPSAYQLCEEVFAMPPVATLHSWLEEEASQKEATKNEADERNSTYAKDPDVDSRRIAEISKGSDGGTNSLAGDICMACDQDPNKNSLSGTNTLAEDPTMDFDGNSNSLAQNPNMDTDSRTNNLAEDPIMGSDSVINSHAENTNKDRGGCTNSLTEHPSKDSCGVANSLIENSNKDSDTGREEIADEEQNRVPARPESQEKERIVIVYLDCLQPSITQKKE